jgi:hypothetical protein
MSESLQPWAEEELLYVRLGHVSRVSCAVGVLASLTRGAGLRVTEFADSNARWQQPYGLLG